MHKKQSAAVSAEREKVQTKLDVATGLAHLGQASYEKAAATFLKLGPPKGLEDWNGKVNVLDPCYLDRHLILQLDNYAIRHSDLWYIMRFGHTISWRY